MLSDRFAASQANTSRVTQSASAAGATSATSEVWTPEVWPWPMAELCPGNCYITVVIEECFDFISRGRGVAAAPLSIQVSERSLSVAGWKMRGTGKISRRHRLLSRTRTGAPRGERTSRGRGHRTARRRRMPPPYKHCHTHSTHDIRGRLTGPGQLAEAGPRGGDRVITGPVPVQAYGDRVVGEIGPLVVREQVRDQETHGLVSILKAGTAQRGSQRRLPVDQSGRGACLKDPIAEDDQPITGPQADRLRPGNACR